MSKTPYELRFEIFKQAYNMLIDSYSMKLEIERTQNSDGKVPYQMMNFIPTLDDVLKQAEIVNNFVSSK